MYKILQVNGPRGVLPSVYYKLDGSHIPDKAVGTYLCDLVDQASKEGDLIVYMSQAEYDLAKKVLDPKNNKE